MQDTRSHQYTAYLRRIDDRLFLEADQDSRNPRRRAYWVKYRLTGHLPLKIAAISDFPAFYDGPGDWLAAILWRLDWRDMVESAKVSFSRAYDARRALGLDQATSVPVSVR